MFPRLPRYLASLVLLGVCLTGLTAQAGNRPPIVAATLDGPDSLLAGATGTFSITASDPDGDTLTYAWTQQAPSAKGTWVGSRTGSSAQWYSPAIGTRTSFTLKVSVTDGRSAPVVRSVTIPVTVPRYGTDIQPVWRDAGCTRCHPRSGGLNLSASSYTSLVGARANVAECNTLSRVSASKPGDSVLVRKLEGTACGSRMPRNNPTYFDQHPDLLVRVRSWVLAGALDD
nr:Ig-like domain-containing protein [Pyxidicoccus fallax]